MGYPPARSEGQSPAYPTLPGPQLACHHCSLYPPDRQSRSHGHRGDQSPHGNPHMGAIADIFRLHGPAYRAKFEARMLPSHLRAMQAIEACRTEALGGPVYYCEACQKSQSRYHSCKNRHCPTCQHDTAYQWLTQQRELLLPVPYFLVTFTLPEGLREVAQSHQHSLYTLLFRSSAVALQKLA